PPRSSARRPLGVILPTTGGPPARRRAASRPDRDPGGGREAPGAWVPTRVPAGPLARARGVPGKTRAHPLTPPPNGHKYKGNKIKREGTNMLPGTAPA